HRVAAAADGDVERRPRPARIGQACGEAHLLDEALGVERGLDLPRAFAPPPLVAEVLELRRDLRPGSHAYSAPPRRSPSRHVRSPSNSAPRAGLKPRSRGRGPVT